MTTTTSPPSVPSQVSSSKLVPILEAQSIFLTGATGFLGKVLLHKLINTCRNVRVVYVLVRGKKGQSAGERLDRELLSLPVFDELFTSHPHLKERIKVVEGDIAKPYLGLSSADRHTLEQNVTLILHCAATTKFMENLRVALEMNVQGPRRVLALAKRCKQLRAFVHVSTCYVNCVRLGYSEIRERIYPFMSRKSGKDVYQLLDEILSMSEAEAEKATPHLIPPYPNTYTFSKALGEVILQREVYAPPPASFRHDDDRAISGSANALSSAPSPSRISYGSRDKDKKNSVSPPNSKSTPTTPSSSSSSSPSASATLATADMVPTASLLKPSPPPPLSVPVLIVRPSIVGCAAQYPLPGWVDSLIGANGLLLAEGIGALHTMRGRGELVVDFIPVDFVANAILGASAVTLRRNLHFSVAPPLRPASPSAAISSSSEVTSPTTNKSNQPLAVAAHSPSSAVPHNVVLWNSDNVFSSPSSGSSSGSVASSLDQYRPQAKQITVYHIATSAKNPCLWDWPRTIIWGYFHRQPARKMVGRPFVFWAAGPLKHFILHCFLHVVPAALMDSTRLVRGKRAKMLTATRKLNKVISSLAFFTCNQWFFSCDNIDQLIEEMDPPDRQLFNFDVRSIDWETYFITYSQGIKRFLLKEGPPRTVEDEGVAPALRSRL
jgi:hypothetical protein